LRGLKRYFYHSFSDSLKIANRDDASHLISTLEEIIEKLRVMIPTQNPVGQRERCIGAKLNLLQKSGCKANRVKSQITQK
jgi:hypothetical protein